MRQCGNNCWPLLAAEKLTADAEAGKRHFKTRLCDSRAAYEKLQKQHEALPGAAMAEMEAAHKRMLDEHKAEAKAQYAKMLSEIQQLQNTVFRLKFGALP